MSISDLENNKPVSFHSRPSTITGNKEYRPVPKYDLSKPVRVRRNGVRIK